MQVRLPALQDSGDDIARTPPTYNQFGTLAEEIRPLFKPEEASVAIVEDRTIGGVNHPAKEMSGCWLSGFIDTKARALTDTIEQNPQLILERNPSAGRDLRA